MFNVHRLCFIVKVKQDKNRVANYFDMFCNPNEKDYEA